MTTLNIKKLVVTSNLTKTYVENLELNKYTRYKIFVPYNNRNFKLTGVDGGKVRPHKSQTWIRD